MRSIVLALVLVTACGGGGGKGTTAVANTGAAATSTAVEPAQPCTATVETARAGNHDRYAFEGPEGLYGYKNRKGDVIIPPTLRYAYEFKPSGIAAAVANDSSFVFIDTMGKVIAQAYPYDNGPDYFQEGFARIIDDQKKLGFINERGEIIISPRFDEADSYCYGKARVRELDREVWIDTQGNETTPPEQRPAADDESESRAARP